MNIRENVQSKEEIMSRPDDVTRHVKRCAYAFQLLNEMEERVIAEKRPEATKNVYVR